MLIGVLLAGGKSARMGKDKAALVLDGETLGARAVRVLRAVCDDVVCAGHGRGVPEDVVRIADPGDGPLVALAGALALLKAAHASCSFVVLPVDMPGIQSAHLAKLIEAARHAQGACFGIHGHIEPLPLVFAAAALPHLAERVAQGEKRLSAGVRALSPAIVALTDAEQALMRNLNTPTDLRAWLAEGR